MSNPTPTPAGCDFCHGIPPSSDGKTPCGWCAPASTPVPRDEPKCTCAMVRAGTHLEPPEWERDPDCPQHPYVEPVRDERPWEMTARVSCVQVGTLGFALTLSDHEVTTGLDEEGMFNTSRFLGEVVVRSAAPAPSAVPSVGERGGDGAALIAAERLRQVSAEGWTPEHDDHHRCGQLASAAVSYATYSVGQCMAPLVDDDEVMELAETQAMKSWIWDTSWWKPSPDPVRNLARAGALIAAEIDRIQRAAADPGSPS